MWQECEQTLRALHQRDVPHEWSTELLSRATVPSRVFTVSALHNLWRDKCASEIASLERQLQEIFALVSFDPWTTMLIDTRLAPSIMSQFSPRSIATLKLRLIEDQSYQLSSEQYGFTVLDYASLGVYCSVVLVSIVLFSVHKTLRTFGDFDRSVIVHVLLAVICACAALQIFTHTGFKTSNTLQCKHAKVYGLSGSKIVGHEAKYDGKKFTCLLFIKSNLHLDVTFGSRYGRTTLPLEQPFELAFTCSYTMNMSCASFTKHTPSSVEEVSETIQKEMFGPGLTYSHIRSSVYNDQDKDGATDPAILAIAEDLLFIVVPQVEMVLHNRITILFQKCCERMLGFHADP
jgi:hypothetical protein